jgi:hypothetical protein
MKKNIFLFFEGLASNVIDSQVLIHCKNMKKIGVEFEIWAFACNEKLYEDSLKKIAYAEDLSSCKVRVFRGVRPAYPFSENINAHIVEKYIKKYNTTYQYIHARTDYSACVASLVGSDFIWDCRGDTKAEFETEYKNSTNILAKMYKRGKISKSIHYAKKAKKAIFVSNYLKQKHSFQNESYIIGCAADERLFFYDQQLRNTMRKKLGFKNEDKILIYAGGMAHYQMFAQCVELFETLDEKWVFLVLTPSTNEAKKHLEDMKKDRYLLVSASIDEVNGYLNAADVGIMLRESNDLNKAASPTKYAEYSMSGLQIIFSDGIGDLEVLSQTIGNKVDKEALKYFRYNHESRIDLALKSKELLAKSIFMELYKKLYEV